MKGVHWLVWVTLFVLFFMVIILTARKEKYAAPRDETTQPPYIEPPTSNVAPDSQIEIYKDMGGLDVQVQAGNPILNFIQGDPRSNVIYGDFVATESLSGKANMYEFSSGDSNVQATPDTGLYIPELTSPTIPFLGDVLPRVPKNPNLVPMSPDMYGTATSLTPSSNNSVLKYFSNVVPATNGPDMSATPSSNNSSNVVPATNGPTSNVSV